MPPIHDPDLIRAILESDRPWSVYALGDLAPGLSEHAEWYRPADGAPALLLLFRAFGTPVLFTLGTADAVRPLLEEIRDEPTLCLHIRPEIVPLVRERWKVHDPPRMWRMLLDPANFRPPTAEGLLRLGPGDLKALERLYSDGEASGEAPEFFTPEMLEQGIYFAAREGGELVAAAGTHLLVPTERVAAIGNVYTRRDRRGRGLAARVTSAVASELLRLGLPTIALNVSDVNSAARRVYERLGFRPYCEYYEGVAVRDE
jgi:GNAT superfamily N-acetyltransferase